MPESVAPELLPLLLPLLDPELLPLLDPELLPLLDPLEPPELPELVLGVVGLDEHASMAEAANTQDERAPSRSSFFIGLSFQQSAS